jgi:hypothetical protein
MKTSGITAALPAQDPARARAFYVARMPGGGEAAWFKDSEGNLLGIVPA